MHVRVKNHLDQCNDELREVVPQFIEKLKDALNDVYFDYNILHHQVLAFNAHIPSSGEVVIEVTVEDIPGKAVIHRLFKCLVQKGTHGWVMKPYDWDSKGPCDTPGLALDEERIYIKARLVFYLGPHLNGKALLYALSFPRGRTPQQLTLHDKYKVLMDTHGGPCADVPNPEHYNFGFEDSAFAEAVETSFDDLIGKDNAQEMKRLREAVEARDKQIEELLNRLKKIEDSISPS